MSEHSEAIKRWENQLQEFQQTNSYADLLEIDGGPIEFEWNIFPGHTSLEMLQKVQEDLQSRGFEPEGFRDRIICMSMLNQLHRWTRKEILRSVFRIPIKSRITRRDSRKVIGHSLGQEKTRSGTEPIVTNLMENETL